MRGEFKPDFECVCKKLMVWEMKWSTVHFLMALNFESDEHSTLDNSMMIGGNLIFKYLCTI